jgi:hypothetical protein
VTAAGVPIKFITPRAWKRAVGLTLKSKDAARSEAIRRWPDHAALFARVKDDGRAESALIGVAGQTARQKRLVRRNATSWQIRLWRRCCPRANEGFRLVCPGDEPTPH